MLHPVALIRCYKYRQNKRFVVVQTTLASKRTGHRPWGKITRLFASVNQWPVEVLEIPRAHEKSPHW